MYIYIYIRYVPTICYISLFPRLLLLIYFWNSRSIAEPHSRTTTEGPEYPSTEKEALYFAQVVADCPALFIAYCPHCLHCYFTLLLHVVSGWERQPHNLVIAVGIEESSHLNLSSQCALKIALTLICMNAVWGMVHEQCVMSGCDIPWGRFLAVYAMKMSGTSSYHCSIPWSRAMYPEERHCTL